MGQNIGTVTVRVCVCAEDKSTNTDAVPGGMERLCGPTEGYRWVDGSSLRLLSSSKSLLENFSGYWGLSTVLSVVHSAGV